MGYQAIFRGTTPGDGTGDTNYVFTGKLNAMLLELYGVITHPILLANITGAHTQQITEKTNIPKLYIGTVSGTPSVSIGTTLGGVEIMDSITDFSAPIIIERDFMSLTTLYITVTGGNINMQLDIKPINV